MTDSTNMSRADSSFPASMSAAQRAFLEAAENLGATAPSAARSLTELPRLSSRELDELVELGVVREAADWRYYMFRPRNGFGASLSQAMPSTQPAGKRPVRFFNTLLFWLLMLLIPVVLLQLGGKH